MSPEQLAATVDLADGHSARVYSTGEGEPLLLLHGWSLDRRSFAPQRDALAGREDREERRQELLGARQALRGSGAAAFSAKEPVKNLESR